MPVGWFFAPYARRGTGLPPVRYCVITDFKDQIIAAGGQYAEAECLGNEAIVKVRAPALGLQAIADDPRFTRIPKGALNDTLADLTPAQRQALRDKLEGLGYPTAEIQERLGTDLADKTVREVLRFACRRRRKPRYDWATNQIIIDGPVQLCVQPEDIDRRVSD